MILYSINYKGVLSNFEWSIVTIHKSLEGAKKAKDKYEENFRKDGSSSIDYEYRIVEIDTDYPSDCIYDYDKIDEKDFREED